MNNFTHELLRLQIEARGYSNMVFSPASIEMFFGMLLPGSQGATRKALLDILEISENNIPELMQRLQIAAKAKKDVFMFGNNTNRVFANSFWYHPSLSIKDDYLQTLRSDLLAGVFAFSRSLRETEGRINSWASERINRRITDPMVELDQDTEAILINTIYLKATWKSELKPKPADDFFLLDGSTAPTKYMSIDVNGDYVANASYYKGDTFHVLSYPSNDGQVSLEIYLPYEKDGLPQLLDQLTPDVIKQCNNSLESVENFYFILPKFKINQELDISQLATQFGLSSLLESSQDWQPIFGDEHPHLLGKITQPAEIFVHEKGIEAIALTIVSVSKGGSDSKKIYFKAKHPFFYRVVEYPTRQELFRGIFTTPTHQ